MNWVLIGFKNSGKSTIGQALAQKTRRLFVDTDRLLEQFSQESQGEYLSVHEIYRYYGEAYFRALESEALMTITDLDGAVIASGGGLVIDPHNVAILKRKGQLIYLNVAKEVLWERYFQGKPAAFLDPDALQAQFDSLWLKRHQIYQAIADKEWILNQESVENIVDQLIEAGYGK